MTETLKSVGIIIVAHGNFGECMLNIAEMILGPLYDCASIRVDAAHDVDEAVRRLNDAAVRLDTGAGVLILTDMFGGTPTNLALSLPGKHKAEVVTGVNLPMLIKAFESRETTELGELAKIAADAGNAGIVITGNMLRAKAREKGGQE